jgi:hypothetical protein
MEGVPTLLAVSRACAPQDSTSRQMGPSARTTTNARRSECAPTASASTWTGVSSVSARAGSNCHRPDSPASVQILRISPSKLDRIML